MSDTNVVESERPKFNKLQVMLLAYVEQKFWETGHIVSPDAVAKPLNIPVNLVTELWTDEVSKALQSRGLPVGSELPDGLLTPKQIALVNMLVNTHDKASIRQKLKDVGVSSQQYSAWLRQQAFKEYLVKRSGQVLGNAMPTADLKLVELVEGGDLNAIKFINELTGRYNPKIQVDFNVNSVLVQIIEVLSRHIEPALLKIIADEIEMVTTGQLNRANQLGPVVETTMIERAS